MFWGGVGAVATVGASFTIAHDAFSKNPFINLGIVFAIVIWLAVVTVMAISLWWHWHDWRELDKDEKAFYRTRVKAFLTGFLTPGRITPQTMTVAASRNPLSKVHPTFAVKKFVTHLDQPDEWWEEQAVQDPASVTAVAATYPKAVPVPTLLTASRNDGDMRSMYLIERRVADPEMPTEMLQVVAEFLKDEPDLGTPYSYQVLATHPNADVDTCNLGVDLLAGYITHPPRSGQSRWMRDMDTEWALQVAGVLLDESPTPLVGYATEWQSRPDVIREEPRSRLLVAVITA